jgi:hypothetical protein
MSGPEDNRGRSLKSLPATLSFELTILLRQQITRPEREFDNRLFACYTFYCMSLARSDRSWPNDNLPWLPVIGQLTGEGGQASNLRAYSVLAQGRKGPASGKGP